MDKHSVISIFRQLGGIDDQIGAQTRAHVEIGVKRHVNAEQFSFRQEFNEFFYLLWRAA